MPREPEIVEFDPDDLDEVVERMHELAESGGGWVNFRPAIDYEGMPPPPSLLSRVFSARGPEIPLCSWVPGATTPRGTEPTSIGVQHGAGMRAMPRLAEFGLVRPEGARLLSDHPRRGLVLTVPNADDDEDVGDVVDWLLRAAVVLTRIDLPLRWRAEFHQKK